MEKQLIQNKVIFDIYYAKDGRYDDYGDYLNKTSNQTMMIMDWDYSPIITFYFLDKENPDEPWSFRDHNIVIKWLQENNFASIIDCIELINSYGDMLQTSKNMYMKIITKWFEEDYKHVRPNFILH